MSRLARIVLAGRARRLVLLGCAAALVLAGAIGLPGMARSIAETVSVARLIPHSELDAPLVLPPRVLHARDVDRYERIMSLQEDGQFDRADRIIRRLDDDILMGHVLAQRYLHPTAYRSRYGELRHWLEDYADHPQAERIHRLALRRRPAEAAPPETPVPGYLNGSGQELIEERFSPYRSDDLRSADATRSVRQWLRQIEDLVSRDRPTQATGLLDTAAADLADEVEQDIARWTIARGYFANRMDERALEYVQPAAWRSGSIEPRMHWTAGLAAWRAGRLDEAGSHFAALAKSEAPGEAVAAGAFWAARAFLRTRQPEVYVAYLERAADASDGFYGLLAQSVIGRPILFDWHEAEFEEPMRKRLLAVPGARRAIALAQIGENGQAAHEIRKVAARAEPQLSEALAALAGVLGLPATQMRVAQRLRLQDGRRHDGALYPIPRWRPDGGFTVDRALVFALMRAESGFDPGARSPRGALGLMQILPDTARATARYAGLAYEDADALFEPVTNMTLGQAYLERLFATETVGESLTHIALAYNAGLTRTRDWAKRFRDIEDDPLLYLESVPVPESRGYVKKVLTNLWAYRARLGQPMRSLGDLAANDWPRYVRADDAVRDYAQR